MIPLERHRRYEIGWHDDVMDARRHGEWHMDTNRSASRYYTELYYHVVWGTYNRHPMLRAGVQEDVYRFLVYKCEGYGYQLFAVNGMEDHIHLVLRLRPSVCVSEMISKLKGSSA